MTNNQGKSRVATINNEINIYPSKMYAGASHQVPTSPKVL